MMDDAGYTVRAYKSKPTQISSRLLPEDSAVRAIIGSKALSSKIAQPTKKPFEIYDGRCPGCTLLAQPSGVRSYYARFGRNRRIALGKVGALLPEEARRKCQKVLGNLAHGRHLLLISTARGLLRIVAAWIAPSRTRRQ